jgi:hypothetical protein
MEDSLGLYFRTFEVLVMAFKLTTATVTFQAHVNDILWKHPDCFVVAYVDSILVSSKDGLAWSACTKFLLTNRGYTK